MEHVKVEISLKKAAAYRIAKNIFMKHKRTTLVNINSYDKIIIIEYRGVRTEDDIDAGMKITRITLK